jgi:hypothetical protein
MLSPADCDAPRGSMNKPVPEPAVLHAEVPYAEECWDLLERMVASPQLRRATRLREFLLFVGQRSLRDGLDQIHEQEIGARVFGRPADYDTSLDNIVRVNASELRKRIDEYFASDGAAETLVMEIPRGSYRPVFRQRAVEPPIQLPDAPVHAAEVSPESLPSQSIAPATKTAERRLLALAAIAIVALSAACLYLWTANRALRRAMDNSAVQSTPVTTAFWSQILGARPNTDIILADTSFALIEDISRRSIPLSEYLSRNFVNTVQTPNLSPDRRADLGMIMQRNNGSLGDFRAAQRILELDPPGKSFHLYSARDYTPALVKQDNIILIGARKSNPWVDLFSDGLTFTAEYDTDRERDYIRNKAPAAGEQARYESMPLPTTGGYAVISYLQNPQQSGKVLIVAGTDSAATEGASDFLTSEDQLARFQNLLHVTALPYFELVLKTTNLNGTPIDAQIVAYRTYPATH